LAASAAVSAVAVPREAALPVRALLQVVVDLAHLPVLAPVPLPA
jgi:hypothetical protein